MRLLSKISSLLFLLALAAVPALAKDVRVSQPIASVLRQPLPSEDLKLSKRGGQFVITGPTFSYRVEKSTGVISAIRVERDGREVISQTGPADILLDDCRLSSNINSCRVSVIAAGKDKIMIEAKGVLCFAGQQKPEVNVTILHTFFNDGVVVSTVMLKPRADLEIKKAIAYQLSAQGEFGNYLHKRRDEHGDGAARGRLPSVGEAIRFSNLTSCLSVFSPTAALAIFTDGGATHLSQPKLDTATVQLVGQSGERKQVALTQYVVHVAPGDRPFVLKAGEEFTFRTGISVAPNRLPHPRTQDLRMFIWIGDEKYPYPTDAEITKVAQWGYTVFQLHRVGTVGEPRPPTGEFERVLRKVHETGMLFVWEENADLLYDSAPGVQALKAKGQWKQWEGFNYDGRYKAAMDPYCDLVATCLASPNGLAEYRLANISRMMAQFDVDGIYLDDNLAYANCMLWKEHGHPQPAYDCLIELHEMNWRRRELLRTKIPHAVLISHNTKAFVLPILADFDVQYFGEGYCFDSAADYWENYRAWSLALNAQAMICPGDDEGIRCSAALACNYDLLNGGGQYSQMDWRLFPQKFKYAGGLSDLELTYSKTYNLAQGYFGLYESKPYAFANATNSFATTTPQTHATIYRNEVWGDLLIAVANMSSQPQQTLLEFRLPTALGILPEKNYLRFDIHRRATKIFRGADINEAFSGISVPRQNLQLYAVRELPKGAPLHVWGGKRISEKWDAKRRTLSLEVQGPAGLEESIFVTGNGMRIEQITVDAKPGNFYFDPAQGLVHGVVTFTAQPLKIEVRCSSGSAPGLPEKAVVPDELVQQTSLFNK